MRQPDTDEFQKFIDLLMESAAEDYQPWLFRCEKQGKAPAVQFGSWKSDQNLLTIDEAIDWMEEGGNIGIAGMSEDRLVNVDIDDDDATDPDAVKPTLMARSRSRTGRHFWYFEEEDEKIPNIPTEEKGEIRSRGQYVLAPGSYVETDPESVPTDQRDKAGYYTIENETPVNTIRREELPDVFLQELRKSQQQEHTEDYEVPDIDGNSAVFEVTARDVAAKEGASTDPSDRWESAFHGSTTGSNMSLSNKGRIQCWRHNVAHGGLQALVALSEYPSGCAAIGTGHKNSNAGSSCIHGDDSAIWHAWKYAKQNGYIPDNDPIPYRAIKHICLDHDVCPVTALPNEYDPENGETIPAHAWDTALSIVHNHYDLNPGREKTEQFVEPKADGAGVAAETIDEKPDDTDQVKLTTGRVLEKAGYDPDDTNPDDIASHEAAYAIDRILQKHPDWHFLVMNDDSEDIYTYHENDGIWRRDGERRLKQICRKAMRSANRRKTYRETVYTVEGNPNYKLNREELGAPDATIATPNGLLDLRKRETRPLRPTDHAINQIQTEYNPAADYENTRFIEFLKESVHPADLDKLQEYAGYCLWRHAQPFGKALFLVGPTNSGKGTFLKAIREVIGEENIAHEALYDLLQTRWGAASLFGSMINIRNEVTPGGLKNIQKFKELTGGEDTLSAEYKGQDKFDFEVTQKFLFATNQMPDVENADGAFFNRCLFVSFPNTVPDKKQDNQLLDELRSERQAILNWMLEGLDRLFTQTVFTNERSQENKETILQQHGDSVDRFVHSVLEITGDSDDVVHKKDLYQLFTRYCDYNEREADVQQTFTTGLKENEGVDDGRSRRVNGDAERPHVYEGIRVNEQACKELQQDLPRHAYSDESNLGDSGNQAHLG